MNVAASAFPIGGAPASRPAALPRLDAKTHPATVGVFVALLLGGLAYCGYSLVADVRDAGANASRLLPYYLLGLALLIALGFEFVNGFHDTANAVATVIYTHSLPPNVAVLWSGFFNFVGVLTSSGAVAFGIISLLPVELILQVSSGAGFAMVFALLIAAIIWNLGTWWLGLPASSSHTLVGSILGVGIVNALMHGQSGASGVDWSQATKVGWSLLISPLVGFGFAALAFLALKTFVKNRELYESPKDNAPPPWWIRGLLITTCTGVSFAHGSNDGQKGMGLIMLILVGTVPMAYALNRAMPEAEMVRFAAVAEVTQAALLRLPSASAVDVLPSTDAARKTLADYVARKQYTPALIPALAVTVGKIGVDVKTNGSLANVPSDAVTNVRNEMYLASEAIRNVEKSKAVRFDADTHDTLTAFKHSIDDATKFIPTWVKVAVAVALGLGTMVGWKRIVVTVGEKIGKTHLSYAQGASAEFVAMLTIGAADAFGLPVSTTHVLSSGVAGTMAANRSGLQMSTVRNLALAWVLTMPAAIVLSGSLYWLFSRLF